MLTDRAGSVVKNLRRNVDRLHSFLAGEAFFPGRIVFCLSGLLEYSDTYKVDAAAATALSAHLPLFLQMHEISPADPNCPPGISVRSTWAKPQLNPPYCRLLLPHGLPLLFPFLL